MIEMMRQFGPDKLQMIARLADNVERLLMEVVELRAELKRYNEARDREHN